MLPLIGIIVAFFIFRYVYKKIKEKQNLLIEEKAEVIKKKKLDEDKKEKVALIEKKYIKMQKDIMYEFENLNQREIDALINKAANVDLDKIPNEDSFFNALACIERSAGYCDKGFLKRKLKIDEDSFNIIIEQLQNIGAVGEKMSDIKIGTMEEMGFTKHYHNMLSLTKKKYAKEISKRRDEIEKEKEFVEEKNTMLQKELDVVEAARLGLTYDAYVFKKTQEEVAILLKECQESEDEYRRDELKRIMENQEYELELQREKVEEQRQALLQDQIIAQKKMQEIQKNSSNSNASRSTLFLTGKCSNCWKKISKFSNRCPYCTSEIS